MRMQRIEHVPMAMPPWTGFRNASYGGRRGYALEKPVQDATEAGHPHPEMDSGLSNTVRWSFEIEGVFLLQ